MSDPTEPEIDWSITTFDGARREQLRRWAELPLIEILAALEEMEMLAGQFGEPDPGQQPATRNTPTDQQPIARTVGRRHSREGRPLTAADREAMTGMAQYLTRAPKGVFRYRSAAEMDADRLRWTVDAMMAKAARR